MPKQNYNHNHYNDSGEAGRYQDECSVLFCGSDNKSEYYSFRETEGIQVF